MADLDLKRLPMTQTHKEKLLENRVAIVEELEYIEDIIAYMTEKGSLQKDPAQEALAERTPRNKARSLLDILPRHSDLIYYDFVDALEATQDTPKLNLLLRDDTQGKPKSKLPFIFGRAKEYATRLKDFHLRNLERVRQSRPVSHNVELYVPLHIHRHVLQSIDERRGYLEYGVLESRPTGECIEREKLFQKTSRYDKPPKVVLIIGPPGSGKTATAYDLLNSHSQGKLWKDQYSFIVFILLREIALFDPSVKMNLKELMMNCFGPSTPHEDRVWQYIENHQDKILLLFEGYDEYNPSCHQPLTNPDHPAPPGVLIDNLLKKNLLPNAHLLITGRVHTMEKLQQDVDRVLELGTLTSENLQKLVNNKLPQPLAKHVLKFISSNSSVASLCSIPVNAISLIDYIEWMSKDKKTMPELPKTRASLLLMLIINLLHRHGVSLKDQPNLSAQNVIMKKRDTLKKLCNLAFSGIIDPRGPRQIFTEEDLAAHGLTLQEVTETGLMTAHVTSVADIYRPIQKLMVSFLHYTFHEELSTIHVLHEDTEQLVRLASANTGTHDMTTLLALGLCTDPSCLQLLQALYPYVNPSTYTQLVPRLLEAAWTSPRRYYNDGELWCLTALGESGRYDLSGEMCKVIVTPLNSLQLWNSTVTSAQSSSVISFFDNIPESDRFSEVQIRSRSDIIDLGKLMSSRGFTGLSLGADFTSTDCTGKLAVISNAINRSTSIKQVKLVGDSKQPCPGSVWDKFNIKKNRSIEYMGFQHGMLKGEVPQTLSTSLTHLCKLHALDLGGNNLSCKDTVSPLYSLMPLTSIKHLRLHSCNLCALCTPVVVELMLSIGLLWLDISRNPIRDEGAMTLAEGLTKSQCALSALSMYTCSITSVGIEVICSKVKGSRSLRCLDAGGNDLSGSCDLMMFTMSSLTELSLYACKLNPEAVCSLLRPLANNSSPVTWLNIGGNELNDQNIVNNLEQITTFNTKLQALCLADCSLTANILHKVMKSLTQNTTLQLLAVGKNQALTAEAVVNLVNNSKLEHLGINNVNLRSEGWGEVARAIVDNQHVKSYYIGDQHHKSDMSSFFDQMHHYPHSGPLRRLIMYGDRAKLANQASSLKQVLPNQISLSFAVSPNVFYALSGLWYTPFSSELTAWLIGAGVNLK